MGDVSDRDPEWRAEWTELIVRRGGVKTPVEGEVKTRLKVGKRARSSTYRASAFEAEGCRFDPVAPTTALDRLNGRAKY